MLQRFMELLETISLILLKYTTGPPMLTALEVQAITEFIELLRPFEEATKLVCREKYVTASKTIPIVNILKNKLELFCAETESAKRLKKRLLEQFNKRF